MDSSSLRRWCQSSVPNCRSEALRGLLRRAAQWDLPCQGYARKLRRWQPEVVLRCMEAASAAAAYALACRDICLPSLVEVAPVLEENDHDLGGLSAPRQATPNTKETSKTVEKISAKVFPCQPNKFVTSSNISCPLSDEGENEM